MRDVLIWLDGTDFFVSVDGVKIAKRGQPGTPQAGTWIPLEPGWTVRSSMGHSEVEIGHDGVRITRRLPDAMRRACRACRGQAGDRDVRVSVVLNAKAFTPCRTFAVATVRSTWAEHEQPESTAAVGAAAPLIGSCDSV